MSNAQVLYLHVCITKKLSKHKYCLQKLVADRALLKKLQPSATNAEDELSKSEGALDQALVEAMSWLRLGRDQRTKEFEDWIAVAPNDQGQTALSIENTVEERGDLPIAHTR